MVLLKIATAIANFPVRSRRYSSMISVSTKLPMTIFFTANDRFHHICVFAGDHKLLMCPQ